MSDKNGKASKENENKMEYIPFIGATEEELR